ncbi:hypothetical protein C1H46_016968 [Malus baccata]|uniref:Cytochrome P450 n=1 Tax=Malus baccata TaxID=106549 RepID=A0A540MG63_MALBA|nr:hypothetical protein C1H46_016968 [Malus baccata]
MDVLSFPLPPPIAISLAVVILTVLVIRFRARRLGAEKKKIYHPVVTNFLNTLINFPRLHHYMTEFEHKHKSYRAYNVLIDYVITTDPANVEYILKTNFANYGKGWYHSGVLSDALGDGIFAVDGEKWLHQRKVAGNELTTKVLKDFSSTVFKTNAVKLARIISEAATCNKVVEIQILLGIELDTMYGTNEEGIQFAHAFDVANEMTIYRYVDFSWKIRRFLNIGSEALLRKNVQLIDQFIYNLIKRKIETDTSSEDELLALKKGDIISRLLKSPDADPKYLRDLILCLIAAGRDTTASTLTWFIYMLCKHPHIQEKVAKEVREATNLKDSSRIDEVVATLTEEALEKMQYLHAALSETLRLYPSVPLAGPRFCLEKDFAYKQAKIICAVLLGCYKFKLSDEKKAVHYRIKLTFHIDGGLYVHASPRH